MSRKSAKVIDTCVKSLTFLLKSSMTNPFNPLQPADPLNHRDRILPLAIELGVLAACTDLSDPRNQQLWKQAVNSNPLFLVGLNALFIDDSKSDAERQAKIAQADQAVGMVAGKAEVDDADIGMLSQHASLGGSILVPELAYAEARVQGTLSRAHGMRDAARRARDIGFKDNSPQSFGSAAAIDYEVRRRAGQAA